MLMMSVNDEDFSAYPKLLTMAQVVEITTLHKRTIEKLYAENKFPKPLHIGTSSRRWWKTDILGYLRDCEDKS
jgi:predicted DNA-binding transcriptional regulator AlpA